MKWDIIPIIFKNLCLHDIIEHCRLSKNKALKEKLLLLKHSNNTISFTKCVRTIEHDDYFNCIIQLTDGRILTGHKQNPVCIWSKDTFKLLDEIPCSHDILKILQINNATILTVDAEEQIHIWEVVGNEFKCINGVRDYNDDSQVYSLAIIDNSTIAFSTYDDEYVNDGYVGFVDIRTAEIKEAFETDWVIALLKMNENYLVTCLRNGTLELRDLNNSFQCLGKISSKI
jgi:hypothetical protein